MILILISLASVDLTLLLNFLITTVEEKDIFLPIKYYNYI